MDAQQQNRVLLPGKRECKVQYQACIQCVFCRHVPLDFSHEKPMLSSLAWGLVCLSQIESGNSPPWSSLVWGADSSMCWTSDALPTCSILFLLATMVTCATPSCLSYRCSDWSPLYQEMSPSGDHIQASVNWICSWWHGQWLWLMDPPPSEFWREASWKFSNQGSCEVDLSLNCKTKQKKKFPLNLNCPINLAWFEAFGTRSSATDFNAFLPKLCKILKRCCQNCTRF